MAVSGVVVKRLSSGEETEVRRFDEAFDEDVDGELAVLPAYRRRGAATTLLEELKHLAKERGCVSIWVLTDEDNEAAVASYRKAGGEWDGATTVMFEIYLMR